MEDEITKSIAEKFLVMDPLLDERGRRLWAAVEARALGRGGVTRVAAATGMSRSRIHSGLRELAAAGLRAASSRRRWIFSKPPWQALYAR